MNDDSTPIQRCGRFLPVLALGWICGASSPVLAAPPDLIAIPPDPSQTTTTFQLVRPPASTHDVEMWLGERVGRFGDYEFAILGGKPGHQTPQGTFQVEWRNRMHYSRQFNNAPMPYSVFFKGGAAIHEGSLSTRSHGCVHVTRTAAAKIFNGVRDKDTRVIVYP
jgi:lipoprotein-anchoring transpeptidase ErfK/SrfK